MKRAIDLLLDEKELFDELTFTQIDSVIKIINKSRTEALEEAAHRCLTDPALLSGKAASDAILTMADKLK